MLDGLRNTVEVVRAEVALAMGWRSVEAAAHQDDLAELRENLVAGEADVAASAGNLGLIYREYGELDEAEMMFRQQLDLATAAGDKDQQGHALGSLGLVCSDRDDLAQARVHWRQATDLFRELGSPRAGEIEGWLRDAGRRER